MIDNLHIVTQPNSEFYCTLNTNEDNVIILTKHTEPLKGLLMCNNDKVSKESTLVVTSESRNQGALIVTSAQALSCGFPPDI